jgi:Putative beta-barrel porin-2, OmpL-like. bbp2
MNQFKKSVLASAMSLALASPAAFAEIQLGEGLSVKGFVDMSFVYTDDDAASETTQVFGIDQVETDFMYKGADGISAQVDIQYGESGDGSGTDETFVEEAYITKVISDQVSVKAGRFLSYSGWETAEPTGLFQYSGAGYGDLFYGGYQQGVSAYYDGEGIDVMGSVVNNLANPTDNDTETLSVEVGVAIEPAEGVTAKLFYLTGDDTDIVNFWTSYSADALTLALEYSMSDFADDSEASGYLLMANYAMGLYGVTLRYHDYEVEDASGATTRENDAITIAPSYAVSDDLLIVAEYRMDSFGSNDSDSLALEALFTF